MTSDDGTVDWRRVARTVLTLALVMAAVAGAWAFTHPATTDHYTRACGITTAGPADVASLDPAGDRDGTGGGSEGATDQNVTADPDGDTIPTALEEQYGSDPRRKTLYLQLVYGADQPSLAAEEQACLQRRWAELPIGNPDGSTGVEVFVRGETRLDRPLSFEETIDVPGYFERNLGAARPEPCVDHVVFVGHSRWPGRRGAATIGGYASIVDVSNSSTPLKFLTHEVLHNAVGFLNDDRRIHTRRGLLGPNASEWSLSAAPRTILNESGFRAGYGGNTIYGNCQDP